MDAAAVGGAFLSAFLQVLFDRMASRDFTDFFRTQKLDDALLRKLKITLLAVSSVLNDAEEKQITNAPVKAWLDELKDAIYDAEDLLDEISTEALRRKLQSHDQAQTSMAKVRTAISNSLNSFAKGIRSNLMEITDRLENFANQTVVLGLINKDVGAKSSQKLPITTSLVDESGVYGRDDEKEEIIKLLLLSNDANGDDELGVITIVGMGGLGKTTVAQLVYNDARVNECFDLKAWVCVSEEFDAVRVTRAILEAISSSACGTKDNLNLLQVKLQESLTGKKFLIILDDVWNERYRNWDDLRNPFRFGAKGSKIIVTTRSERVASIMRTTPTRYLKQLSNEHGWLLFAKHAFYNGNSSAHPNLEVIGREIVKKCKGLPLAVKTLAGLLRSEVNAEEWDKILKSEIWDLPNDRNDILPALRLSYHYLPSHLKRCFAYCSIFPKDYEFKKEQLVLLWMAEGFLQPQSIKNQRMEDLGDGYFCDLISRSFFQQSCSDELCFVMHDLINDLANVVSGEFCFKLEGENSHEIPGKTRHLSYLKTEYDTSKTFEALYGTKCFRTFLSLKLSPFRGYIKIPNTVPNDLLPTLRCLRVLSLSKYYNMVHLPKSIGNLKHLRYLNLSQTSIENLPDSICTLYNLQTLILLRCGRLIELPSNMGRLINLRHLDIRKTKLREMPRHVSNLKSLQTLSTFVVGKQNGCMITELKDFRHLRGALEILKLENVVHARYASEANLKDKVLIEELTLGWSHYISEDSQNEGDVLDKLQPHANLKKLTIKCYGGTRFPDWLGDPSFSNIVYLGLSNCKNCLWLPPLGQLSCLKELSITGFDRVERVGPEFYGNGRSFESLEILEFEMSGLVEWFCSGEQGGEFPRLMKLFIVRCRKLRGRLPDHLPCLRNLCIRQCPELIGSLPDQLSSLVELKMADCEKLVASLSNVKGVGVGIGWQRFSSYLETLQISDMSELTELPPELHRLAVKDLIISNCPSLESFNSNSGGSLNLPTSLKTLSINNCKKLELFQPETIRDDLYSASLGSLIVDNSCCNSLKTFPLGLFPNLNSLELIRCENLGSLSIPEGLHVDLTCLNRLAIWYCPKIVSFPKGGLPTPNLTSLSVYSCKNLKSLPERMGTLLPSLQNLNIMECPELESFPDGGLPSNLTHLSVDYCGKLTARRRDWGLQRLPSLKHFTLERCYEVESFPEEWLLPSTLTSLSIRNLQKLKWLDKRGLQHLTSLEELRISNSPKLQSLPEEGLPTSLSFLEIYECPLLKQRCRREKGKDWPKAAHITRVVIDFEVIS